MTTWVTPWYLWLQLSAALQHMEQDRAAQIAHLSAQLGQAQADAESTAAASSAAHSAEIAEMRASTAAELHQVGFQIRSSTLDRTNSHIFILSPPSKLS